MRGGAGSWEAPPVDYLVLGPVEVRDAAGRPVPLGPPRQRALLAVLALSAGRMVPLSRLVDELWGEAVPDSASKMVQIHISQLRKVLPRDDLVTRSGGYLLDVGPARLDLGRFERLRRASCCGRRSRCGAVPPSLSSPSPSRASRPIGSRSSD
jgi:DNA-binding SARP family transcriptional activator